MCTDKGHPILMVTRRDEDRALGRGIQYLSVVTKGKPRERGPPAETTTDRLLVVD